MHVWVTVNANLTGIIVVYNEIAYKGLELREERKWAIRRCAIVMIVRLSVVDVQVSGEGRPNNKSLWWGLAASCLRYTLNWSALKPQ